MGMDRYWSLVYGFELPRAHKQFKALATKVGTEPEHGCEVVGHGEMGGGLVVYASASHTRLDDCEARVVRVGPTKRAWQRALHQFVEAHGLQDLGGPSWLLRQYIG